MNRFHLIFPLLLASLTFFVACDEDDDHDHMDTEAPVINIMSPTSTAMYMSGDSAHIHVVITDNDELHEYSAVIERTHMGSTVEVWNESGHEHTQQKMIHADYVIDVPGMHNDFTLRVTASDHSGNETTDEVSWHVHM